MVREGSGRQDPSRCDSRKRVQSSVNLYGIESHMTVFPLTFGDRRWSSKGTRGGYQGPIEALPELMAACNGKEDNFTWMVREVLQPNQIAQVRHPALVKHYKCKSGHCSHVNMRYTPLYQHKHSNKIHSPTNTHTYSQVWFAEGGWQSRWSQVPPRSPITSQMRGFRAPI